MAAARGSRGGCLKTRRSSLPGHRRIDLASGISCPVNGIDRYPQSGLRCSRGVDPPPVIGPGSDIVACAGEYETGAEHADAV